MEKPAVTTYVNGNIYTVNGYGWENRPCSSMAVDRHGVILAVGSDDACKSAIAPDTVIVDLKKSTILPGLVDSHVHAPGRALTELHEIDLRDINDCEAILKTIKDFICSHPENVAYHGTGVQASIKNSSGESLCAKWLDEICADKPITIITFDMHSLWLNSKAMEICGITAKSQPNEGGMIHRFDDGTPTGIFTDVRNIKFLDPVYTREEQVNALRVFISKLNSWGYTSIMSIPPYTFMTCEAYLDLEKAGDLTANVNCGQLTMPDSYKEDLNRLEWLRGTFKESSVKIRTAKFFIDGVVEGKTAYLKQPYKKAAGVEASYCGGSPWTMEQLNDAVFKAMNAGYQCHMHTVGDAAVEMALDAIESTQSKLNSREYRSVLTHLQLIAEEDKDRFAEQKVIACIQPFWHFKNPMSYDSVEVPFLGEERASKQYPAQSLVQRGVVLTSSADYPITSNDNPFYGIQAGATRNVYCNELGLPLPDCDDKKYLLKEKERLTVPKMIESYTINGAYEMFREKEVGSLETGKFADFIAIDQDPIGCRITDIHRTNVTATVHRGRVAYGAL